MIDFESLNRDLLSQVRLLLPAWLPAGKLVGQEFCCGSLRGEVGDSLKVNINTGIWADFASNDKGGDLISLYAAINGLSQIESAQQLVVKIGHNPLNSPTPSTKTYINIVRPPMDGEKPMMHHYKYGSPSHSWMYADHLGRLLFYVARYDLENTKQFLPWSFDGNKKQWVSKGYPAPRPLYNLPELIARPTNPVLIVEGEKAADAAKTFTTGYVVVSWPNGAKAVKNADWKPLYGRNILIWPDADEPGEIAAIAIQNILTTHCPKVNLIDVSDLPDGYDAADLSEIITNNDEFIEWLKTRIKINTDISKTLKLSSVGEIEIMTEDGLMSESQMALWHQLKIPLSSNGLPICNLDCALRVFEGTLRFKDFIWYDEFHRKILIDPTDPKEYSDIINLKITTKFQREFGLKRLGQETVHGAALLMADSYRKNEPKEYFESLQWDRVPRVNDFFSTHMGSKLTLYEQAASRNWWISMIARVYQPGCQMRNMIILEGPQETGKSKALKTIGDKWYVDCLENIDSNNFFQVLQGRILVEIGELSSFRRAEMTRIKQVVSCQVDRFRAPYDRLPQDNSRTCVFVGSTNDENYFDDPTGATRFWPIKTTDINIKKIKEDRDQLFAEAINAYKDGETWHIMPSTLTKQEQESRYKHDEWEHIIAQYLINKDQITIADICENCLQLRKSEFSLQTKRISLILKKIGWESKIIKISGASKRIWLPL